MRAPPPEVQASSSRVRAGRAGMEQLVVMLLTWQGWMIFRRQKNKQILPQLGTSSREPQSQRHLLSP